MNLKPIGDKILVKPDAVEEKTIGGIILTDETKVKPNKGTIIKIGNQTENKFETKPGDRVLYGGYSGTEVHDEEGNLFLIMREDELFTLLI